MLLVLDKASRDIILFNTLGLMVLIMLSLCPRASHHYSCVLSLKSLYFFQKVAHRVFFAVKVKLQVLLR